METLEKWKSKSIEDSDSFFEDEKIVKLTYDKGDIVCSFIKNDTFFMEEQYKSFFKDIYVELTEYNTHIIYDLNFKLENEIFIYSIEYMKEGERDIMKKYFFQLEEDRQGNSNYIESKIDFSKDIKTVLYDMTKKFDEIVMNKKEFRIKKLFNELEIFEYIEKLKL